MTRYEELKAICDRTEEDVKVILIPLIDDVIYLEEKLKELKKMPSILTNPNNPMQMKQTSAGKQYKEYLQQYNNCVKILIGAVRKSTMEEESPLRAWMNSRTSE